MSYESWAEEFYPVPANDVDEKDAVAHSLKKWEGLMPANREKHNVVFADTGARIRLKEPDGSDFDSLVIDGSSCSLCVVYDSDCSECPLANVRGGYPCDHCIYQSDIEDEAESPWHAFLKKKDPTRMIYWLEKAKELS
jgi:hypothetical protein